ncbi:MAG: dockerin type I repeat-containing protein [Clostridia bacterium]|nr:dockerin type I repeat-containing protein [Clostridia bacterium]
MGKQSNFFKRAQTWVLTVALLLTVFQPILSFVAVAEDKTPVNITVGQLVVGNYDELTESEKALIESGVLVGDETLTYTKPDANNGDEVISVNTDNKTVTVKAYKDGGYTWQPVSVKLVNNGAELETLTLVDGKATYEYDGNAFAVVVDYKLEVEVDEDVQNGLLTAPQKLSDAVAKLDAIAGVDLSAIVMALPELREFATDDGMKVYEIGVSSAYVDLADAAKPATNALIGQLDANGGKLDLQLMVEAYEAADHKVAYAIANGEAIVAKAIETYEYLAIVLDGFDYDGEIKNKDSLLGKIDAVNSTLDILISNNIVSADVRTKVEQAQKSVNTAISVFETAVYALEAPCASGWTDIDGIVKAGLTDVQLKALDGYVASIAIPTTGIVVKNPLYVETVTVQHNMSMYNVTVNVELELTGDNNAVSKVDTVTATVTLAEGATTAEILDAVKASGVVDTALAKWNDKYVAGKFDVVKSALPAVLEADTVYTITYTPAKYNVKFAYGATVAYPYGATVVLEKHADATKAYDYKVNGTPYAQGELFVVEGDVTVTREEGKSYTASTLFNIIANNYLSGKGAAILTSGALFGDVAVNVRYPDENDELVSLDGNELTAKKYAASYAGLYWTAYSYTLTKNEVESEPVLFNGNEAVEISGSFDYVTVIYRLNLTDFSENTVLDFANLPHVLAEEATAQKAALDRIAAKNGTLAQLKKAVLSVVAESINDYTLNADSAKDAALKASFGTAFNGIINECYAGSTMKLSTLIDAYLASSDKIAHYYANHEEIRGEIAVLAGYLSTMLAEEAGLTKDDKKAALEVLLTEASAGMLTDEDIKRYVDSFESIEDTMNSVLDDLSVPNAAIDLTSPNLGKLTAALDGAKVDAVNSYKGLYLTSIGFTETSDETTLITVNVNVNGTTVSVTSELMYNIDAVPAAVIEKLVKAVNAKIPADSAYYNSNYSEVIAALNALVGEQAGSVTKSYTINYTYKEFTVSVPEADDQTVTAVDKVINLPASQNAGTKYVYIINGTEVPAGTHTLSDAEFASLVAGNLKITLKKIDVLRENLINYVNSLNANSGDTVKFALVENKGEYSIVLKIDGLQPNALMSAVMGTAQGMITGDYAYVGLGGEAFIDGKIYLQSVLDAFMNSGFGDKTIVDVMDANGNINNMKLSGTVISNASVSPYGGKLLATTMQLGNTASDAIEVDFYVTLGSVSEEMVQVRNVLAGKVSNYFGLVCEDGYANLSVNLPEKAYEAFLAMLLVTEKIDIANINAVNSEIAIGFFHNLFMPTLTTPGVTVETFDNTLSKFGFDMDLSSQKGAESLYNYMVNFYTTANYEYDKETGYMVNTMSISAAIDAMNLGSLGNMIAEKDTGLKVALSLTIEDLGNEYDALFVDINANGVANKAGLSTNIADRVKDIEGTAVIVLLDDVDTLTIKGTTLLNLNGYTVNGDLNCKGKVIVVDTRIADGVDGGVTGNVTGNAIILGGKYANSVSAFVKNGYVQDANGVVTNKYYNIVEDSEGNVIVELNAGVLHTDSIPSIPGLAIDLACDLLFNGYSSNYLELAGNTVYDISFEDLVGIYASADRVNKVVDEVVNIVDSAELSALINLVLDDVFNFTAISEAIKADEPILSYEMVTKPWSISFSHVPSEDYITAGIVSGEPAIVRELSIVLVGEEDDKAYFADLFAELGRTVFADINVYINHGLDGKALYAEVSADADVFVDYTNPNYAVMFSVMIADGIGAPANTALVEGIEEFYATNGDISDLAFAFNSLTVKQVVTALKNLSLTDDFDAMVARLGLDGIVPSKVAELEDLYDRIGKVAAAAVRKADITGNNRKLGTFLDADGAYSVSRSNFARYLERNLFKGYSASASVEVTDFYVGVKLFADDVLDLIPEFVDGTGTPDLTFSDKLVGYQIDFDGNYIIIDTHASGITVDELKALVNLYADNADYIDIALGDNLSGSSLVPNGTKLLATAGNEFTDEVDTVEYTVIVLGDINGNGTVEVGDAVLITRHLVYDQELSVVQKLAADTSNNGRIDVGDAVRITRKKLYWDEYKSLLEEVED